VGCTAGRDDEMVQDGARIVDLVQRLIQKSAKGR
jgi:hypothetical protein